MVWIWNRKICLCHIHTWATKQINSIYAVRAYVIAFQIIIIIIIGDGMWWPNCTLIIRMKLCAVNSWIWTYSVFVLCWKTTFFDIDVALRRKKWIQRIVCDGTGFIFLSEKFNSYVGWLSSIFGIYFVEIIYMMRSFFSCESKYMWC